MRLVKKEGISTWYEIPRLLERPWIPKTIVKITQLITNALVIGALSASKHIHTNQIHIEMSLTKRDR